MEVQIKKKLMNKSKKMNNTENPHIENEEEWVPNEQNEQQPEDGENENAGMRTSTRAGNIPTRLSIFTKYLHTKETT